MDQKPIDIAIAWAGSKQELAKRLGIGRSAVSQWGENVPYGRAYQIEIVSGGAVKATDLLQHKNRHVA